MQFNSIKLYKRNSSVPQSMAFTESILFLENMVLIQVSGSENNKDPRYVLLDRPNLLSSLILTLSGLFLIGLMGASIK